jgi:tetratricopeptide (TPR) repeat protein
MQFNESSNSLRWRGKWTLILLLCVVGATAMLVYGLSQSLPGEQVATPIAAKRWAFPRIPLEDSGYTLANKVARGSPHDPTSLESIRAAFHQLGYRGIAALRRQPARTPEEQLDAFLQTAALYGYEGDFVKAGETLDEARAIADADPVRFAKGLPTLIFLQGVLALRRGEVENCVECPCQRSCIFPLQASAFHQKRTGSRLAVKYFSEYLEGAPDDIGVRWLLNVAYMTLGEYPDGVPAPRRLPLDPFRSEFDIGRFVDVAPALGLNRLHCAGGAIVDDFDNDGLLDVIETSSHPAESMAFYRNQGDGTFRNRAKEAGLETQWGGLQCVQTDYNNDGWLDIFVVRGAWTEPQRPSLLRNNKDGTFTDMTAEAGLMQPIDSQVAVWADYDNDGWLDLFVGGESVPSRLYHNRGDGTFEEVADKVGVRNKGLACKGANWGDWNDDGYPDLFVSNLNGPPRLFQNNRDGTFSDVAFHVGITQPSDGFSCWFWDYDNDGWLDLFVTGYERDLNEVVKSQLGQAHRGRICRLYRNRNGQRFQDVSKSAGLNKAMAPMGSNFGDFDGDGFLDFYLGTGTPNYSMLVPNRMFKNVGGKRFADITLSSGTGHLQKGHGVACGDWDRNGSVDLFVQMGGAAPGDRSRSLLFQNPAKGHHWITVRLVGKKSNRPAIGARIKVTLASGQRIYRHVTSGSSFGANSLQQTIGVGAADSIASLEVHWPTSGTTQVFRGVRVDQAIEVTEFDKTYRALNWSPLPVAAP